MTYRLGSPILSYMETRSWEFSLMITQQCNLRCTYCYEHHKNPQHDMSREIGYRAVDFLFECAQPGESVIFDLMGGEIGLVTDLARDLVNYFKRKLWEYPTHPWQSSHMIAFNTNGTLYHTKAFQQLLWENRDHGQPLLTIDGTKRKHDTARVFPDGTGSYDMVAKNARLLLQQYPRAATKVTFASADLGYLTESILHLWDMGFDNVNANVVYEDVWRPGDPELFESELCRLADVAVEKGLWKTKNTSLFWDPRYEEQPRVDSNYCGTGKMMSVDSEGNLYTCLRFQPFTMARGSGRTIGNIWDGVVADKVRAFSCLRKSLQSPQKCRDCTLDHYCGWCKGYDYDISGTLFHRATFICEMHKAQWRGNQYYWRELERRTGTRPEDVRFVPHVNCPM